MSEPASVKRMANDRDAIETTARVSLTIRLSPSGITQLDHLAADEDRTRSAMVRVLLKEALAARARKATR